MTYTEKIVPGAVELWTESFGDPRDPAILLVMGSMSQGALWPDAFVGRLAAAGHHVIRYDHRDTGRSGSVDFERDPYTWADVRDDIVRVMDAYGLDRADIVAHSAGGLLAQWLAVAAPELVRTLTVIGSSPLGGREGLVLMAAIMGTEGPGTGLPAPREEWLAHIRSAMTATPPSNHRELIDSLVADARALHGDLPFDEDAERAVQEKLVARSRDLSKLVNHRLAAAADMEFEPVGRLGEITAPTLVVEGTAEPVKPGHGRLIAEAIPGAELLMIEGMGHTLPPEVHAELADAILKHVR
ncbi:hydrolase [Actinorhabdospora filicis]|uniref:Hydrolase n=1 Tax=Actinorhabdospora filicis TaxID=1785913 RepID=A0A9W6SS23_9ACTN|nr:alpha/beta fold hydrolase [Actinorhabdospora filicis]GLZ79706.1 hydrolase [Actinorhabdospora filicis]